MRCSIAHPFSICIWRPAGLGALDATEIIAARIASSMLYRIVITRNQKENILLTIYYYYYVVLAEEC